MSTTNDKSDSIDVIDVIGGIVSAIATIYVIPMINEIFKALSTTLTGIKKINPELFSRVDVEKAKKYDGIVKKALNNPYRILKVRRLGRPTIKLVYLERSNCMLVLYKDKLLVYYLNKMNTLFLPVYIASLYKLKSDENPYGMIYDSIDDTDELKNIKMEELVEDIKRCFKGDLYEHIMSELEDRLINKSIDEI